MTFAFAKLPRLRLLPPELGWVPYAWLVYLATFFIEPALRRGVGSHWLVTIAATILFLASYFRAFWECGARLIGLMAFHVALGLAFSPINTGAAVFFIYATSFAGQLDRPKDSVRLIGAITVIGGAMAWAIAAPGYYWMSAILIAPLIGAVNLRQSQAARADAGLRRAHAEIERLAAVAERERIARDLHDVLGHTLSLIILKSELASKLADQDPRRATKEIRDVEQVARTALARVRETVRGYRATLDREIAEARALLEAAGIGGEFAVELSASDPARDAVFAFVLREGVTNVVRHSDASTCRVRIAEAADAYRLTVADDGRDARVHEGNGVRGMRERVVAAGGTLSYHSRSGTCLTATLPRADTISADIVEPRLRMPLAG